MNWSYRIIRHREPDAQEWYGLHEVYYDEAGKPINCSREPIDFVGDDQDEIVISLERALADARGLPVLDASIFNTDPGQEELWRTQLHLLRIIRTEILEMTAPQLVELKQLLTELKATAHQAIAAYDQAIEHIETAITAAEWAAKPKSDESACDRPTNWDVKITGLEANLLLSFLDDYIADAARRPGYDDPTALQDLRDRLFRGHRHPKEGAAD